MWANRHRLEQEKCDSHRKFSLGETNSFELEAT
jgi:hypothetical protein